MRVTGGTLRSRSLRAPRGSATRPTSDRVREALFSILQASREVEGARVLDLYAGTGALAIEALSRGAAYAVLVENGREAISALNGNLDALGLRGSTRLIASSVEKAASALAGEAPFDIVLADPPYAIATTDAPRALARVVEAGLLAPGAVVVLEHASKSASPLVAGLSASSTRRYGDTALSFYESPL